jgi:parallel beta-helix repeat protein
MTDHVVDATCGGGFTTVSAAISAASPGDRILVRPGRYDESLVVDKQLEIVGDGPRLSIEIWGTYRDVLWFRAPAGRVAGLTFAQPGGQTAYGVSILGGQLLLEGCDIASYAASCVFIHAGSDPVIRGNLIHDARQCGVLCYEGARGLLEGNEIVGSRYSGVEVRAGASPLVRRNTIRDGQQSGIYVHADGSGTFEQNLIAGNAHQGVLIKSGGRPAFRGNQVTRNGQHGVDVEEGGGGVFEDNDLTGNRHGAWRFAHHSKHNVARARNRE